MLKIATRGTPLALAQVDVIINEIKKFDSSIKFEIIKVKTSGDIDQQSRLMDNQNFFTKEIDKLILEGKADIAVHSLKDTGLIKIGDIKQVAFSKRDDPRDILIFNPKLIRDNILTVGSSSPRRKYMAENILPNLLPHYKVNVIDLRGNIGTRIGKISNDMQGIILASCGPKRINFDLSQHEVIHLPLSKFTPAPGQGIIVAEMLSSNPFYDLISKINHKPSMHDAQIERNILAKHGGGCHQKFGIFSIAEKNVQFASGKNESGEDLSLIGQNKLDGILNVSKLNIFQRKNIDVDLSKINAENFFVANKSAVNSQNIIDFLKNKKVYVSGVGTWQALASLGIMVHGCAESLGYEFLSCYDEKIFANKSSWCILTNEESVSSWQEDGFNAIASYKLSDAMITDDVIKRIESTSKIFWPSIHHFYALEKYIKSDIQHFCGYGKTAKALEKIGIKACHISINP